MPRLLKVVVGSVLVVWLSAACVDTGYPTPPEEIASGLEQTFPTLRDLRVGVYMENEDCEYFAYRGGHFTSKPQDEYCRVFVDAEHFMDPPVPIPFDDQARRDLDTMKAAFRDAGLAVNYLNLAFPVGIDGGTNAFSVDRCRTFYYRTIFEEGPDPDSVTTVIDDEWVVTDFCKHRPRPSS